jgi:hypothetical protein
MKQIFTIVLMCLALTLQGQSFQVFSDTLTIPATCDVNSSEQITAAVDMNTGELFFPALEINPPAGPVTWPANFLQVQVKGGVAITTHYQAGDALKSFYDNNNTKWYKHGQNTAAAYSIYAHTIHHATTLHFYPGEHVFGLIEISTGDLYLRTVHVSPGALPLPPAGFAPITLNFPTASSPTIPAGTTLLKFHDDQGSEYLRLP